MNSIKLIALALSSIMLFSGCAKEISSSAYTEHHVGEASTTYKGKVVSVRKITVTSGDSLEDNKLGLIGGAVAGGVVGNQFGGGRAKNVTTVVGALAGATAGAMIEKKAKTQEAFEYIVELKGGRMMTIVQGLDTFLPVGQKVFVMVGNKGRSRLVTDNS